MGIALAGCHAPGFDILTPADRQGADAAHLWRGTQMVALAVGVIVWGLIAFVTIRYRRRRRTSEGTIPSQRASALVPEIIYIATPLVIVVALFVFTTGAQRHINAVSTHPDLRVEVSGFQWGWKFHYPDGDITVTSGASGTPGFVPPELVLPIGRTTEIDLTATDVVHAFYVPAFLFQRNAVPGTPTRFNVTPTRIGSFGGRCATFCGIRHTNMELTVRVVPPDEFTQWIAAGGHRP